MFGISKDTIMRKIAEHATQDMITKGEVKIDGFGTLTYNKETGEYKFFPSTELEQRMRRTGQ